MKPVVIYIDKNSSKVTLTKEEFEKYLKDAYDNGYSDGYASGKSNSWNWPTYPTNDPITMPHITWDTTPNDVPNPYQVTCEAHNTIGE